MQGEKEMSVAKKKRGKARHPVQPLITDPRGVTRFKKNQIVDLLASNRLNELAAMGFPDEDWIQLAQLIGYSLDGFETLSYVTGKAYEAAAAQPVYIKQH
jgi:hypothetical protein